MKYNKSKMIFILCLLLMAGGVIHAQTDTLATVIFEQKEAQSLKSIAGFWNWMAFVAAIVIVILGFFGLKTSVGKWAEQKAMESFAQKINVKGEYLEFALRRMAQEYEQRSKSKILVASQTSGQQLALKDFLEKRGFKNFEFKSLNELGGLNTNGLDLLLFNFEGKKLSDHESEIAPYLRTFKQNVRLLVLGRDRLPNSLVDEIGRISFSNDLDTLEQRIMESLNRPV